MILLMKSTIGGMLVLIIHFTSRSSNFFLAGIVPLIPVFAVITHYMVGSERSTPDLKQTILFTMFSLLPYAVYLVVLFFLVDRMLLTSALICALIAWLVVAMGVYLCW